MRVACLLSFLALAAGQQGCTPWTTKLNSSQGLSLSSTDEVSVNEATFFTVAYLPNYKYVRDLHAGKSYVLYQSGCAVPSTAALAATHPDFNASVTSFFAVPVTSVACGGTAPLPYLARPQPPSHHTPPPPSRANTGLQEALGVFGAVEVLDMTYVTSPCLQRLAECGTVSVVDSSNASAWSAAVAGVQLVLTDSYGIGASGTERDVVVDDTIDPGLLNRAEWVKFISLFFDEEEAANGAFTQTQQQVAAVASVAANAASASSKPLPVVAFTSYYGGVFYPSTAAYKQQVVAAAGGVLAELVPLGSSSSDTAAQLRDALAGVDVLIDSTYLSSEYDASPNGYTYAQFLALYNFSAADAASGAFPFLSSGSVFRLDKQVSGGTYGRVGWDFFENGAWDVADFVRDFALVLHPSAAARLGPAGTRWLRNLSANEPAVVLTSALCADPRVAPACGGASLLFTLPRLNLSSFSPAALAQAVAAALPANTLRNLSVVDYPISGTLTLAPAAGKRLVLPGGGDAAALFAALIGATNLSLAPAPAGGPAHRRLAQAALAFPFQATGLGGGARGVAAAAAALALLSNSTAVLAACSAAGVRGAASATASSLTVSALVSLTAATPVQSGALLTQLSSAPFVTPPPAARSAAPRRRALAALLAAALAALL